MKVRRVSKIFMGLWLGLCALNATGLAFAQTTVHQFTVVINGEQYTEDETIKGADSLTAVFYHPLSRVTHVRMQHPDNPQLARTYAVETPVRLRNHESHLRAKHDSSSEFIAVDSLGNEYGRILLTFKP